MGAKDPEPTVPIADWATEGKALKADPSSFTGYGENVATIRGNLESDNMSANTALRGGGEDTSLSTGGFEPGADLTSVVWRNTGEMAACVPDLDQNIAAIASVALILGDLYKDMDGHNKSMLEACEWAFAMPGADTPDNLPYYIDPKQTIESLMAQTPTGSPGGDVADDQLLSASSFTGATVATYKTSDGGIRSVVTTPDGVTEILTDNNGKTVYEVTTTPDGTTTTTTYRDGKPLGQTKSVSKTVESGDVTDEQTITTQYDENGKAIPGKKTVEHIVTTKYDDGQHTREYYTEDENQHRTNERYIGPQPDPVTGKDWKDLADQRLAETRRTLGGM
ncbi:hypothetical protein FNH05_06430 [Amycolatopsis rhizosphaerae]|uniref:Uncharacterized protein n=1 Tax=Amycolatopsis rhizosphaerae TaxID=2053003 RepID=A0A558DCA4_9PSEU|nr:hypothetical protein [Amycolatopsis rhizosphaerae]TVT58657.1 hypothetical protein FNH05_06430 [Amycolatopsis rhizosphaerae]